MQSKMLTTLKMVNMAGQNSKKLILGVVQQQSIGSKKVETLKQKMPKFTFLQYMQYTAVNRI